jgi:hypothetical protein
VSRCEASFHSERSCPFTARRRQGEQLKRSLDGLVFVIASAERVVGPLDDVDCGVRTLGRESVNVRHRAVVSVSLKDVHRNLHVGEFGLCERHGLGLRDAAATTIR